MYRWLRDTHLLLGLFSFLFVLMYGVSSVKIAHPTWFSRRPVVTETRLVIGSENGGGARDIARELMDRHGVRGELRQVQQTETGYELRIVRPGTTYQVSYSRETGETTVRTTTVNFSGMLVSIHVIAGLWHEFGLTNLWGLLVGVVSAGLIVLGLTGIYLWFKIHKERVVGIVLLALNLGYSLTLMVWMRNL
ncbi:MAG: hypothetical protein ACYTDV_07855 [Planctomycetota bacterium]|jgi:hypothetical protein